MGGMSSEREVSLESGRNIYGKINRKSYDPIPLFMDEKGGFWEIPVKLIMRNSTRDIEDDLATEAVPVPYEELKSRVDVVCIGLHGKYGEDGCVQGLLELLRVPYTGSGVLSSALGMDKYMCRQFLRICGIDVPRTLPIHRRQWTTSGQDSLCVEMEEKIGYPCIVKPSREGCSTAVSKVVSRDGLAGAIEEALLWDNTILVEEFLTGTEVTCGVIEREGAEPFALIPSETIPTADVLTLEDKFLYGQGENKTPARLPEGTLREVQEVALQTFRSLGLVGYARIDMFVRDTGQVAVLEANTLPGMTPSTVLFHQAAAAGITQADLIDGIIRAAISAHAKKRGPL